MVVVVFAEGDERGILRLFYSILPHRWTGLILTCCDHRLVRLKSACLYSLSASKDCPIDVVGPVPGDTAFVQVLTSISNSGDDVRIMSSKGSTPLKAVNATTYYDCISQRSTDLLQFRRNSHRLS